MRTYHQQKALDYYYANREKYRDRNRKWIKENRAKRAEYYRKYRLTKKGREATRRAVRKYEASNPKRKKAWDSANCLKMQSCSVCNTFPAHRHHPNINKPKEVVFLCALHHKKIHSA